MRKQQSKWRILTLFHYEMISLSSLLEVLLNLMFKSSSLAESSKRFNFPLIYILYTHWFDNLVMVVPIVQCSCQWFVGGNRIFFSLGVHKNRIDLFYRHKFSTYQRAISTFAAVNVHSQYNVHNHYTKIILFKTTKKVLRYSYFPFFTVLKFWF